MRKQLTILLATILMLISSGCAIRLSGAGEYGIGYRSEGILRAYHEVDGDKEGVEAKSELDLESLVDLLLKWKAGDESPDSSVCPSSSDN